MTNSLIICPSSPSRAPRYWRNLLTAPPLALRMAPQSNQSLPHLHHPHPLFPQATQCQHPLRLLRCLRRYQPHKVVPVPPPTTNDAHLPHQEVSSLFYFLFSHLLLFANTKHLSKLLNKEPALISGEIFVYTYSSTIVLRAFGISCTIHSPLGKNVLGPQ